MKETHCSYGFDLSGVHFIIVRYNEVSLYIGKNLFLQCIFECQPFINCYRNTQSVDLPVIVVAFDVFS